MSAADSAEQSDFNGEAMRHNEMQIVVKTNFCWVHFNFSQFSSTQPVWERIYLKYERFVKLTESQSLHK